MSYFEEKLKTKIRKFKMRICLICRYLVLLFPLCLTSAANESVKKEQTKPIHQNRGKESTALALKTIAVQTHPIRVYSAPNFRQKTPHKGTTTQNEISSHLHRINDKQKPHNTVKNPIKQPIPSSKVIKKQTYSPASPSSSQTSTPKRLPTAGVKQQQQRANTLHQKARTLPRNVPHRPPSLPQRAIKTQPLTANNNRPIELAKPRSKREPPLKVLVIAPNILYSHFALGARVARALASAGHDVVCSLC